MNHPQSQKATGNDREGRVSQGPRRAWLAVLVTLLIVAVALITVACQVAPPEATELALEATEPAPEASEPAPEPTPPPPEPTEPSPGAPVGINCEESEYAEELGRDAPAKNPYFMDREVILTGPADAIEELRDELQSGSLGEEGPLTLIEIESCTLEETGSQQSAIAMNLYKGDDETSVVAVLNAVNRSGYAGTVAADPNYLVGLLGTSICGSPHGVRPSPWKLEASPHGVRPSPAGGVGTPADYPSSEAAAELFRDQWAFQQIALAPQVAVSGDGVRVGVLDTSPFPTPGPGSPALPAYNALSTVELTATHGVTPSWELDLGFPKFKVPEVTGLPEEFDVSDHGLFVAGLIHAVAPDSRVQLIRVLDNYGCGDLFTLNKNIHHFAVSAHKKKPLDGAVLNLSLGVQQPWPGEDELVQQAESEAEEAGEESPAGTLSGDDVSVLIEDSVESLQQVVEYAVTRGVVVVAAAGNDSYDEAAPLPQNLPAGYPQVIGVSGTTYQGSRSCFSNQGDVAAPAGNGLPGVDQDGNQHACWPAVGQCTGDCQTGLISLVHRVAKGYAYWTGTSFAAPLASGLSALATEQGVDNSGPQPEWLEPAEAKHKVECSAAQHGGIIDIQDTLGTCW